MISHNRITHNGGSNLGGAVAIFTGANGYDFSRNDVCGNFSLRVRWKYQPLRQ